jgi:hypothetical protein
VSPAAQKKVGFSETALAAEAVAVGEEVTTDRRCAHAARRPPRGARGDERTARRQGGGWWVAGVGGDSGCGDGDGGDGARGEA